MPNGKVGGYIESYFLSQGQQGPTSLVRSFTYTSNTAGGLTVYLPATDVLYPVSGSLTPALTTTYGYTWYPSSNQLQFRSVARPIVSSAQNGSGNLEYAQETFDAQGRLTQFMDERGIVNNYTYDPVMGVITQQVLNYQAGVTQPGVNVTTDFTYDNQGRLIQTLGPSHTAVVGGAATVVRPATWYVYAQSVHSAPDVWDVDQTRIGQGYATGAGPSYTYALVNPVTINKSDKDGRSTDRITSRRSGSGSGALVPADTFVQSDWQSWSSTQYDAQHRTISDRTYFLIPASGTGTAGANYGQTTYGYDALERRDRVVAPGGTITRTVWTAPQRVASIWVGTDDTNASDGNPSGYGPPNNMVMVSSNVYDNGSPGGDGNLTQQTQYISAAPGDSRVTNFGYDWRNRQASLTDAIGRYTVYTFDNIDRQTQTQMYATLGGTLIAQSGANYDDRGRVYQEMTYAVDPSTGTVGNALTSNTWYDPSGNVIQQIAQGDGQVFTKRSINGVGWVTHTYRGYSTAGTSYAQATTVANDTIVEQTDFTFDEAGNVVSQATSQRLNDVTGVGALPYGTQPKARVSYAANWFDGVDRSIASANYGAIASFTRPATIPASGATVLVSQTAFDDAGRAYQATDPAGNVAQTTFDAAGRTTQTVEAYGSPTARTTQYAYTLDNLIATLTAVNAATGDQITTYAYGTLLSTSGVARNDLLASVAYPDSVSGSDVVSYTYNRQGQQATVTDQRDTVRTFTYDKLGRQTDDGVTTVGTGTDNAVLRISRTYEVRGMVQTVTSYDNATLGGGAALNQCAMTYNAFGQLTQEQQEHSGTVSGSSPSVQYAYDSGASSSNQIRLNTLTYPNGRTLGYSHGASGGMSDYLNRVDAIQDTSGGTTTLAGYTYIGSGMVVRIDYPQPQVRLDLWGGTSGVFSGLDQFNRIIDQRWLNYSTGTDLDRYQYGYDANSNRLYKANVVGTPHVSGGLDEYYTYDPLNRLTAMQRGVLNSTNTGITATPAREMDYTLDPTGNWSGYLTRTSGTTDLSQTRTSNKVNEITALAESTGPTWVTPAYDAAGNTTTLPQVADPTQSFTASYDAWNRLVQVSASGTIVAQYKYDGHNRRIVKLTYASGVLSETRHFYYTNNWQDIEQRVGTSTAMDHQHVWGVRYVDELVCRDDSTATRLHAMQDANFGFTAICDASDGVAERYLLDPYGTRTIMNPAWSIITPSSYRFDLGHQGLFHDVITELIVNRSRILTSNLGTFMQRDIVKYVDGTNLYLAYGGSPFCNLDPMGTDSGAWKFSNCMEACLANNEPLNAIARYLTASAQVEQILRRINPDWFTGANKKTMAEIALKIGEPEIAEKILRNMIQTGKGEQGSMRIFLRMLTERGKGLGKVPGKIDKGAKGLGAIQGVLELARYTHCCAYCGVLASRGMPYDPADDNFIDDYVKYYESLNNYQPPLPTSQDLFQKALEFGQ